MMMERLWFVIPELVLFVGVVAIAILGLVRSNQIRGLVPWVSGGFIVAGVATALVFAVHTGSVCFYPASAPSDWWPASSLWRCWS